VEVSVVQRQEMRVAQRLPVWVTGIDARGNRFRQSAMVVEISRLGARLGEIRCLRAAGDVLELNCRGRKARFKVVWIDESRGYVGVRCVEPGKNLWRVPLPSTKPPKYEPTKATAAAASGRDGAGGWISGVPARSSTSSSATYAQNMPMRNDPHSSTLSVPKPAPGRTQREHMRHWCAGGAEVRRDTLLKTGDRIWGRLTQVSLGGCFVSATHPFAPKTKISVFLGVDKIQVKVKGVVCRSQPGLGMGIKFTEVDEQNRRGLEEITRNLGKGGRFSRFA
jgi:hypothetical protein